MKKTLKELNQKSIYKVFDIGYKNDNVYGDDIQPIPPVPPLPHPIA